MITVAYDYICCSTFNNKLNIKNQKYISAVTDCDVSIFEYIIQELNDK